MSEKKKMNSCTHNRDGFKGWKGNNMNRQKAFSLFQLLIEVVITLFVASIVIPSFVRSELATHEALAAGSLHAINIAGMAFSYTNQNVVFAILGGLVGAMAALAISVSATTRRNKTSLRAITTLRAALLRH